MDMDGVTESFFHGHPTIYDISSFVMIVILLLVALGTNMSLRSMRRRLEVLERNEIARQEAYKHLTRRSNP